jgi:hypothetical protein
MGKTGNAKVQNPRLESAPLQQRSMIPNGFDKDLRRVTTGRCPAEEHWNAFTAGAIQTVHSYPGAGPLQTLNFRELKPKSRRSFPNNPVEMRSSEIAIPGDAP